MANVNEVVKADGETLISLVDDTVSEETLLEGATAHDASGNQITGKYVPYNPNLLDNPDFSINQRRLSEYRGDGLYCTDRWFMQAPGGELVVTVLENGGIHIENNVGNSGVLQRIEENIIAEGNVYTISVDIDGKRYSTQVVPDKNNNANVSQYGDTPYYAAIVFDVYNGVWAVYPYVVYTTGHSVDVGRAKLELSSVDTAFVPPNPATKLAKCQRYLSNIRKNNPHRADAISVNGINFTISLPASMRFGTPSIVDPSFLQVRTLSGEVVEGFTFGCWYTLWDGEVVVTAIKENHGLTDAVLVSAGGDTLLSTEL